MYLHVTIKNMIQNVLCCHFNKCHLITYNQFCLFYDHTIMSIVKSNKNL